jgi:hypothetical protein
MNYVLGILMLIVILVYANRLDERTQQDRIEALIYIMVLMIGMLLVR